MIADLTPPIAMTYTDEKFATEQTIPVKSPQTLKIGRNLFSWIKGSVICSGHPLRGVVPTFAICILRAGSQAVK